MPDETAPPNRATLSDIDNAPDSAPVANADYKSMYLEFQQKFTQVSGENFELREKIEQLRKQIRTSETLDKLIEPYASRAYWFMVVYCIFAAIIIVYSGLSIRGFRLPDAVLGILVGSTAASVIGLVGMVLTGIFVGARSPK